MMADLVDTDALKTPSRGNYVVQKPERTPVPCWFGLAWLGFDTGELGVW